MVRKLVAIAALLVVTTTFVAAQTLPASPEGKAQVQLGGQYVKGARGTSYEGGSWIEVSYGRPILRGRDGIFGKGADYGKELNAGASVWRAGANVTTRLRTEKPLVIGGKTVPAGEYSVFIELKEAGWTFVLSNWAAQKTYDPANKTELWGSYNYTADKDVVRAPMTRTVNTMSVEQLTYVFTNVTATGGQLTLLWGKEIASVPFTLAK